MFSDELEKISWEETTKAIYSKTEADVIRALGKSKCDVDDFMALISSDGVPWWWEPFRSEILTLLAINLVITFTIPIIDWRAHLGGLVVGAVVAAAFAYATRDERRTTWQAGACVAVALLLVVAVVVRTAALGG